MQFGHAVRDLLADAAGSAELRLAWDSEDGRIPGVWERLAALGVTGLLVPERCGGLGLDLRSALPVLVESGRAALPAPLVETLVAVGVLATAGGPEADGWLAEITAGRAVAAVVVGPGELVSAGPWADVLVVAGDAGGARAVDAATVTLRPEPSIDRGVRLAVVDPVSGVRPLARPQDKEALDVAAVAVAAQLVGLADAMLERSVAYALQREQFGKAIGSFQAVKHQLADVYVATAFAKPVLARAAWSVATGAPTGSRDASHAKHAASLAASQAARTALQVHGGIGYTFEHDLHMWMKRVWTLSSLWGDVAWHRARVAAAVLHNSGVDTAAG